MGSEMCIRDSFNTETLLKSDGKVEIDKTNWESGSSRGSVEVVLQYQL